jgi:threonine/homoserine/homoserine lactone efflux protein
MLEYLAICGTSFVIALSGAMMPGPLLTVTISESPRRGMLAGPLLVLGHGILDACAGSRPAVGTVAVP